MGGYSSKKGSKGQLGSEVGAWDSSCNLVEGSKCHQRHHLVGVGVKSKCKWKVAVESYSKIPLLMVAVGRWHW